MRERVGRRGAALGFFVVLDLAYGYYLLTIREPLPAALVWPARIMPLAVFAGCWFLVAGLCFVYAFAEHDTVAFVAAVSLKVGWGLIALSGWMAGVNPFGWLSATIWLVFAAFVYLLAGGIPPPAPHPGARP